MAGRALWQEAGEIHSREERMNFFKSTVVSRLKELAEIADSYGTPWYDKLGVGNGRFTPVAEGWYQSY